MKPIRRKELTVGILVILAMGILFFGINFLKGVNIFKASNYYYATYTDIKGLVNSAPVTLNGYKIGVVREIMYDYNHPGHVTLELGIDKQIKLPRGSVAKINTDFLGTATLSIELGDSSKGFYAVGDTILTAAHNGLMEEMEKEVLPAVAQIMPKVDSLLANLNAITGNPALHNSIGRLDGITADLATSLTSLKLTMASIQPAAKNVHSITTKVDTMATDLSVLTAKMRRAPVDSMMTDLQQTIVQLNKLTAQLNDPNSTVGKLITDPAVYNNLNATINSLDSLFVDIKRNPKRYVTVKIF